MKSLSSKRDKQISEYVHSMFYCDKVRGKWVNDWEPYEHYSDEWIAEQIENQIGALTRFIDELGVSNVK